MTNLLARHLGLLSLEPWDGVWRRNQHLANQLLAQGFVERITFVEPAGRDPMRTAHPHPGVTTVRPQLRLPRRAGGLQLVAAELLRGPLRGLDLLWVNDAPLGRWTARKATPAFYDVTDDWRESVNTPRVRQRLVRAEDWLATHVRTVVCSGLLAQRWAERYEVAAALVHNGVDLDAFADVRPVVLPGPGPHVGYVGTLHAERLDVPLVVELAQTEGIGTVHLIGPDVLDDESRHQLDAAGVVRHGPVSHTEVPSWMAAMDVLVCPHLVTPFTLSLDAIKAREYLAAGRPVVATATSGFQDLNGATVTTRENLAAAATRAAHASPPLAAPQPGWATRAGELAETLRPSTP